MGELRTMTVVVVHPDPAALPNPSADCVPVWLYGPRPHQQGTATIGGPVLDEVARVQPRVDPLAFDLLSLSLAVTAADSFVDRDLAADGWARKIELVIALSNPVPWRGVARQLEEALGFLSGDIWSLNILSGGEAPPSPKPRARKLNIGRCDCVSLYSGGLDSAIGVLDLRANGLRPVLVSHAYRRDASRQEELLSYLDAPIERFALNAEPKAWLNRSNDVQMRTRSFNFLAMGALMASTLAHHSQRGHVTLYVPENGLIAINPPLTSRRIGALSTRTTHPHYLGLVQNIFRDVGLPVNLKNPYAHFTKGEMILQCRRPAELRRLAGRSVSCGKWKRTGHQCGKCVPCLIRRASFHAANWNDETDYAPEGTDLRHVFQHVSEPDDLMAMILAARRLPTANVGDWIANTGPLPADPVKRAAIVTAVTRGLAEVRVYLGSLNLLG